MRVRLIFQYVAPGATKPDERTVSCVATEIENSGGIPNVGDIVGLPICTPRDSNEIIGEYQSFKVVAKHFNYTHKNFPGGGVLSNCDVYVIVSHANEGELGTLVKE